jgi:prepilin-type N-terminal cleavage/methylation domain-containing protein
VNCCLTKDRRKRAGFTLVEVMAALAILGAALFVLLDAHYGALRLHDQARTRTVMHNFMVQAIGRAEVEVLAGNLSGSGDFGKRYPDYKYSYDAKEDEGDLAGDALVATLPIYLVTVTVEGPEKSSLELQTKVFDPRR